MPARGRPRGPAAKQQKRQAARVRRRERAERGLLQEITEFAADLDLATDPAAPPATSAAALYRIFRDAPPPPRMTSQLIDKMGAEHARAVVATMDPKPGAPVGLAFAADVALQLDGDLETAERHLLQALETGEHPFLSARLAEVFGGQGRLGIAVLQADDALAADPMQEQLQLHRGAWLDALATREPTDDPEAGRALARQHDREPLYELRRAVEAGLAQDDDLLRDTADGVSDWVEAGALAEEEVDWDRLAVGEEQEPMLRLALEWSWSAPRERGGSVLEELAGDPELDEALARRLAVWNDRAIWGLLQVEEIGASGVVLVEYITGHRFHVEMPPEQREGLVRWAVVAGSILPVDGVWRSGSAFVQATPGEARSLAELVAERCAYMGRRLADGGHLETWASALQAQLESGRYLPGSRGPEGMSLTTTVRNTSLVLFPTLIAELRRLRATPPQITNTDGDPMEWIEARLAVADIRRTRDTLRSHPDFRTEGDGLVWYGRELSSSEREQSLARARAEGLDVRPGDEPARYVRGSLSVKGGQLVVEVNSRARLESLLALLNELGQAPRLISEKSEDLAARLHQQHLWMPRTAAPEPTTPSDAAGQEAWLRTLPDEPLDSLGGRTPRQAASDPSLRDQLELFLRDVEYQLAQHGAATGAQKLREELRGPR